MLWVKNTDSYLCKKIKWFQMNILNLFIKFIGSSVNICCFFSDLVFFLILYQNQKNTKTIDGLDPDHGCRDIHIIYNKFTTSKRIILKKYHILFFFVFRIDNELWNIQIIFQRTIVFVIIIWDKLYPIRFKIGTSFIYTIQIRKTLFLW